MTHPGGGSEEFYSIQGTRCDLLMDNTRIGWHQGEVASIISLLVSASLGSTFLQSAVFIWRGVSGLYLYLSGNWEISDSAVWQSYRLQCYQFHSPASTRCFYLFTFPDRYVLGQRFALKGEDMGSCAWFQ